MNMTHVGYWTYFKRKPNNANHSWCETEAIQIFFFSASIWFRRFVNNCFATWIKGWIQQQTVFLTSSGPATILKQRTHENPILVTIIVCVIFIWLDELGAHHPHCTLACGLVTLFVRSIIYYFVWRNLKPIPRCQFQRGFGFFGKLDFLFTPLKYKIGKLPESESSLLHQFWFDWPCLFCQVLIFSDVFLRGWLHREQFASIRTTLFGCYWNLSLRFTTIASRLWINSPSTWICVINCAHPSFH